MSDLDPLIRHQANVAALINETIAKGGTVELLASPVLVMTRIVRAIPAATKVHCILEDGRVRRIGTYNNDTFTLLYKPKRPSTEMEMQAIEEWL